MAWIWILLTGSPLSPAAFVVIYLFIPFQLKDANSFPQTRTMWRDQKLLSLFFISFSDQRLV